MSFNLKLQVMERSKFTQNIEDLDVCTRKDYAVRYLRKYFTKNVHYETLASPSLEKHGGHNKVTYMLTQATYDMIKNTYNMKHRYVPLLANMKQVNLIMSLENQTIGFIVNSLDTTYVMKRQKKIGSYSVDVFIDVFNIVIECDENGHAGYNETAEKIRETFFITQGITVIRFNPNAPDFDMSIVMKTVLEVIHRRPVSSTCTYCRVMSPFLKLTNGKY